MSINSLANTANRACALLYSYIKEYRDGTWLLPVNVCPDVPLTFCSAKVSFEFVDISPKTLCIDEDTCLARLRKHPHKYQGIVYVRTYGYLHDTQHFVAECKSISPNLQIIDDRCLCIPSFQPDMYGADMVLYSTGHCKQIDLEGGGIAFYNKCISYNIDPELKYDGTNEEEIYKNCYALNKPLDEIPYGWLKMETYKDFMRYKKEVERETVERIKIRNAINQVYSNNLSDSIQLDTQFQDWRFNIRVPIHLKDNLLAELFANNLFASNHYHSVNRLFDHEIYINSDSLYSSVINLFNDKNYTVYKAERSCEIINKLLR